MALTNINSLFIDHQKILASFASAQLDGVDLEDIRHNQFYLFSVTSFLFGAVNQLGKQSNLPQNLQQKYLHNLLGDLFKLPRHNAEGLLSSTERMMGNYYLLENIHQEGQSAAEKWLTSDAAPCCELKNLMSNYHDFTMLDMKAAGMKNGMSEFHSSDAEEQNKPSGRWFSLVIWMVILSVVSASVFYYIRPVVDFLE